MGGINNYQYAPNPVEWVDPFGLSCKEAKYKTTPLKPQYVGESNPDDVSRWNFPMVCEYFAQERLDDMELTVKNNLLVYKKTGEVFDSSNAHTHWGNAIFVMDHQGRIFVSNEQIPFEIHHSSLSNGRPVAAAGELSVVQGMLLEVSNQSGHYAPSQSLNNQLFMELGSRGMPAEQLDKVLRTGWKDDGSVQPPKPHARFKEAEQWETGDALPDDWMDF